MTASLNTQRLNALRALAIEWSINLTNAERAASDNVLEVLDGLKPIEGPWVAVTLSGDEVFIEVPPGGTFADACRQATDFIESQQPEVPLCVVNLDTLERHTPVIAVTWQHDPEQAGFSRTDRLIHQASRNPYATIEDLHARVLASSLHEGQASALYALASTGAITAADIEGELDQAKMPVHGVAPVLALLTYVQHHGDRGPVAGWSDLSW